MASKQLTDHHKSVEFVRSSLTANEERLVQALADLLAGPHNRTELVQALRLIVSEAARKAGEDAARALVADDAHAREIGDDRSVLDARDTRLALVREKVVDARATIDSLFGATALAAAGVKGDTPDDPAAFHRFALTFVGSLQTVELPAPRLRGVQFDAPALAAELEPEVTALGQAIDAARNDVRENQASKVDRDRAWAASQRTFSGVANLASALLQLGGDPELARRVRPSGRNPGTVADADPADPVAPTGTGGSLS